MQAVSHAREVGRERRLGAAVDVIGGAAAVARDGRDRHERAGAARLEALGQHADEERGCDEVGVQRLACDLGIARGLRLVRQDSLRDECRVEPAQRLDRGVDEPRMSRGVVQIGKRGAHGGRAARAQVRSNRLELCRVPRDEMQARAALRQEARRGLRDRGSGAEDGDALEAHAVTRRQKLDEKAGSAWLASSAQRGNERLKVSGDMCASLAG